MHYRRIASVFGLLTITLATGVGPATAAPQFCGKAATIVIDAANPDEQGTPGNDVVVIVDGGHDFHAGAGNDSICSQTGPNTVHGGSGADLLNSNDFQDPVTFDGGRGGDDITAQNGTITAGPGDDQVTSPAAKNLSIDLGPGDDTAVLDEDGTTVMGGSGNDRLERPTPAEGIDSVQIHGAFYGQQGTDTLSYRHFSMSEEDVTFNTTTHKATGYGDIAFHSVERLIGSAHSDRFRGADSRVDRFWGLAGNDVMFGNGGNDFLYGGKGHDRADGGPGRDSCRAEVKISCEHS